MPAPYWVGCSGVAQPRPQRPAEDPSILAFISFPSPHLSLCAKADLQDPCSFRRDPRRSKGGFL